MPADVLSSRLGRWIVYLVMIASAMGLAACTDIPVSELIITVTPTKLVTTPTPTATPTPYFYIVQPGDTLWEIARRHGMDLETLIQVNELEDPSLLRPGQRLLISDRVTISGRLLPTPTPTPVPCRSGCREPVPGCVIKGVIARLDGTRMYLLPEDELYYRRSADVWFCREEDARRAGWRRWTPYGPK